MNDSNDSCSRSSQLEYFKLSSAVHPLYTTCWFKKVVRNVLQAWRLGKGVQGHGHLSRACVRGAPILSESSCVLRPKSGIGDD